MEMRADYDRKVPLSCLVNFALENNLIQIVTETTWSRIINGIKKESLIDHIYVNDSSTVANVRFEVPTFGDHVLAITIFLAKERELKPYKALKVLLVFS